jgi:translation initiation factor 5B
MSKNKGKNKKNDDDIDDLFDDVPKAAAAAKKPEPAEPEVKGPSKAELARQKKAKAAADAEADIVAAAAGDEAAAKRVAQREKEREAAEQQRLAIQAKKAQEEATKAAEAEKKKAAAVTSAAKKPVNAQFAAIKAAQEAARENERLRREHEDKIKAEVARLEAEQREKEAEHEAELERRRQDRERRRAEGTLLSKSQREKQAANERARQQFLASGAIKIAGLEDEGAGPEDAATRERRKPQQKQPAKTKVQIEAERIKAEADRREAEAAAIRQQALALVKEAKPEIVVALEQAEQAHAALAAEVAAARARLAELAPASTVAADGGAEEPVDSWEEVADEWDAEPDPEAEKAASEKEALTARIAAIEGAELAAAAAAVKAAEAALNAAKGGIEERLAKEAEARRKAAEEAERAAAAAAAAAEDDKAGTGGGNSTSRAPIVVILGHVDSGKTSLLDRLRNSNVAKGEAGGITQQIGATNIPADSIRDMMGKLQAQTGKELPAGMPGMLMIDTPGHESFSMLRQRGSSMCDLAILIVDVQQGLQQQTLESIEILKSRNTPFVVAVTKVDALYGWNKGEEYFFNPIRDSLAKANDNVMFEFEKLMKHTFVAFAEQSINVKPFWELTTEDDLNTYHPIVPVSSKSGEGLPDLLNLVVEMSQTRLQQRLAHKKEFQCTVLEVQNMPGHGTVLDVILINGQLKENDMIVCAGLGGPVCTRIRSLLTPPPLKESRVKTDLIAHASLRASIGCKISAPNLSGVLAGSSLYVCGPRDDIEDLKDRVQEDLQSVLSRIDMNNNGVFVHASSLGSLEALLTFLAGSNIPVSGFDIGMVHKASITKTSIQLDKKKPEYAVLLAFDVKIEPEAQQLAEKMGVQIFNADVIYSLGKLCTEHFKAVRDAQRVSAKPVFPVVLKQLGKNYVFHNSDPFVCGVRVINGTLRVGTPLFIPRENNLVIGRVTSIKRDDKPVETAKKTDEVSISVDQTHVGHGATYGKHFDDTHEYVSHMTKDNVDALFEFYADELSETDEKLIAKFKELKWVM